MSSGLTRFLGDTPLRTLVKLVVLSVVVGIILAALNLTPVDLWYRLADMFRWIIERGYQLFGDFGTYLVYGAMVVLPVFLVMRILAWRK